jgi:hypothetical protein
VARRADYTRTDRYVHCYGQPRLRTVDVSGCIMRHGHYYGAIQTTVFYGAYELLRMDNDTATVHTVPRANAPVLCVCTVRSMRI